MEKAIKASGAECGYKGLGRDWTNVKSLKLPLCPKKSKKNILSSQILKKRLQGQDFKEARSWGHKKNYSTLVHCEAINVKYAE